MTFTGLTYCCTKSSYLYIFWVIFVKSGSIYVDVQFLGDLGCSVGAPPQPGLLLVIGIVKSKWLKVRKSSGAVGLFL